MATVEKKKVRLKLVGLDGNAFSLMGAFQRQARQEGWSQDDINIVLDECMTGDYAHLLCMLMDYCENLDDDGFSDPDRDYEEEEEED